VGEAAEGGGFLCPGTGGIVLAHEVADLDEQVVDTFGTGGGIGLVPGFIVLAAAVADHAQTR